jgi:hypothetical protein
VAQEPLMRRHNSETGQTRPAGFPLLVGRTGGRVPHGPHLPGAFETLTVHSGWATTDAAALLAELAARVLDAWRPPSTPQRPWPAAIVWTVGPIAPFASRPASARARGATAMEVTPAMGPWELPDTRGGMSRRNRRYFTLARRAPLLSGAACWLWARTALAGLGGDRDRLLRRLSKALPPPDREVLVEVTADPQRWAPLHRRHRRGVPPGRPGARADLALARGGG